MKFKTYLLSLACLAIWPAALAAAPAVPDAQTPAASAVKYVQTGSPANLLAEAKAIDEDRYYHIISQSIEHLEEMVKSGRNFTKEDDIWLSALANEFGTDEVEVPDLDNLPNTHRVKCSLTWEKLAATDGSAKTLLNTLKVMEEAERLSYEVFQGSGYEVRVYNSEILPLLKKSYESRDLCHLRDVAEAHNLFRIKIDEQNGLVTTSDIPDSENAEMASRQWVTDTVRSGGLECGQNPEAWVKALNTLAKFYNSPDEQAAFDKAIASPASYRDGGPQEGVAHIFYPNTLKRDPNWFNNKRLESHGLALRAFMAALRDGCLKDWSRGIKKPAPEMLQAITNLTAYLEAIDYSSAPSAGNWEETPFPGGLTWDTQAINEAMMEVIDLMYNSDYDSNQALSAVRRQLKAQKHGDIFNHPERLEAALQRGLDRVRLHYKAESPGHREKDSSLVFIGESNSVNLDDADAVKTSRQCRDLAMQKLPRNTKSIFITAQKQYDSLRELEDILVRDHGMIRYAPFKMKLSDGSEVLSPDSYLNFNYNIACDRYGHVNLEWGKILAEFGSKDASDPKVFAARASLATENCEAEWFMISDLSQAYSQQAESIINCARRRSKNPNSFKLTREEEKLLNLCVEGATRCLNRAYGRVTPSRDVLKANGGTAPAWSVPEAWQCVSAIIPGSRGWLPGINTPLTWAEVSLSQATGSLIHILTTLENNGKNIPRPSAPPDQENRKQ